MTRYNAISEQNREAGKHEMRKKCKNELAIHVLDLQAEGMEEGVPGIIRLIPKGHVESQKGDFIVDDESFELIQRRFKGRKLDLVIDYEHQTLEDVQAPAAGWITELVNAADAIMAKVEWTARGAEYLKNREYRYLSPVVITRKTDKKVVALHSAALTNTPAIDGMFPIVNSLSPDEIKEEEIMELEKLIRLLGLPEGATEADVEAALQAAATKMQSHAEETEVTANKAAADATVLGLLGLKEGAKTEEVAAAIMQLKAGDTVLAQEVKSLKEQMAKNAADEAVERAMKQGKVSASMKDWAIEYALKDPSGFRAFVEKAPQVVPMGTLDQPEEKGTVNWADDLNVSVLKGMGLSDEDIKKYFQEEGK